HVAAGRVRIDVALDRIRQDAATGRAQLDGAAEVLRLDVTARRVQVGGADRVAQPDAAAARADLDRVLLRDRDLDVSFAVPRAPGEPLLLLLATHRDGHFVVFLHRVELRAGELFIGGAIAHVHDDLVAVSARDL